MDNRKCLAMNHECIGTANEAAEFLTEEIRKNPQSELAKNVVGITGK